MKNSLADLNDHLFVAIEALSVAKRDTLSLECQRAKAICDISIVVMRNAQLISTTYELIGKSGLKDDTLPDVLYVNKKPPLAITHKK